MIFCKQSENHYFSDKNTVSSFKLKIVISDVVLVEQIFTFSSLISLLICRMFILTPLYLGMWLDFYTGSSNFCL